MKFKDMDEVIERANNTMYGLGAGIMTQSIDNAHYLSQGIRAGTVWLVYIKSLQWYTLLYAVCHKCVVHILLISVEYISRIFN